MGSIRSYSPDEYIPVVIAGSVPPASSGESSPTTLIELQPDARQGKLVGGLWTLGSTGTVESIAIPDWANGIRLRPTSDTRFAINEDPVASGAEALTVGNTAFAYETEVRLLEQGTGRTLRLLTTSAGSTCSVGFF